MLVDRVLVIEVANHPATDGLELGKHLPEQPDVVHFRQPRVEARPRPEKSQEGGTAARRRNEIAWDELPRVLLDERERLV